MSFAAQWLAYASPCRRFAADLAINGARLGADVVRVTFAVEDFHLLLLAGLPAHCGATSGRIAGAAKPSSRFGTAPGERRRILSGSRGAVSGETPASAGGS